MFEDRSYVEVTKEKLIRGETLARKIEEYRDEIYDGKGYLIIEGEKVGFRGKLPKEKIDSVLYHTIFEGKDPEAGKYTTSTGGYAELFPFSLQDIFLPRSLWVQLVKIEVERSTKQEADTDLEKICKKYF